MATIQLTPDFKQFLKSLNLEKVEYLVVGSYAVGLHGYVRGTNDLDVWVGVSVENARRIVRALRAFGFDVPGLSEGLFLKPNMINRLGVPPYRIEILTGISGVAFGDCYPSRIIESVHGVEIPYIDLDNLKKNKASAGRLKDLADLERLNQRGKSK